MLTTRQFIILSGVLGGSIFNTSGEALKLAGPVNLIVSTIFTGSIAVCVGETVSEFVQVFPVPNGVFAYIDAWIDEDLGWIMGLLYWFVSEWNPELNFSASSSAD